MGTSPAAPASRDRALVIDLLAWARASGAAARPWLILGKGPSFDLVDRVERSVFRLCSLNHVVREIPVDLAHVIDIDVVAECAEAIDRNARFLVLPRRPHVRFAATERPIEGFFDEIPVLRKLDREGRLVWYNLSSSPLPPDAGSPVVEALHFSAEAALGLLAAAGVRVVRSLGVDGGAAYGGRFADLRERTLLANSRTSFDAQFGGIARTILRTGVFYAPLHKEAPIRVFVETDRTLTLPARVLEHSIKRRARMSVEVVPLLERDLPAPRVPVARPRSGPGLGRFRVPSLCEGHGRAICLPADSLVLSDIDELWGHPMPGVDVLRAAGAADDPGRSDVLLLDCDRLRWRIDEILRDLDAGRYDLEGLVRDLCIVPRARIGEGLPSGWNAAEDPGAAPARLLRFARGSAPPWRHEGAAHGKLWCGELRDAVEGGFIDPELLAEEVWRGHVSSRLPRRIGLPDSPGLGTFIRVRIPGYLRLARALDRHGVAGTARLAARMVLAPLGVPFAEPRSRPR